MDQLSWNFDDEVKEEEEEEEEGHLAWTRKRRMCNEVNLCHKKHSLFCVCSVSVSDNSHYGNSYCNLLIKR